MQLFESVFNKASIYDMLFINVKSVLSYPTLDDLQKDNPIMFDAWKDVLANKLHKTEDTLESDYQTNAINYPEFTKIVGITYSTVGMEDGKLKRNFKKILNDNEEVVIELFMDVLHSICNEGGKLPTLCGYNIISNDIPLLIKRYLINRNKFKDKRLPYILKKAVDVKPWESTIVDVANVWKFNGFSFSSLQLICDFLGLKRKVNLDTNKEFSEKYWSISDVEERMSYIGPQSSTQTEMCIQLINGLRQC